MKLLITHHSSLITHHSSLITHHSSLITHHSSLITHHSSLITHHSSLITHHSSLITDFYPWCPPPGRLWLLSSPSWSSFMLAAAKAAAAWLMSLIAWPCAV